MNKPQYLESPKATDVAVCNWQQGQTFRVMKMDLSDLHSAWYVVMPGGSMLTFNNCADDTQDEAQANWVAHALNAALISPAPSELREALARLVRLEDERIRLQHLHAMGHGTDYDHYHKTLPLAWAAARAALAQHQAPQQGEQHE